MTSDYSPRRRLGRPRPCSGRRRIPTCGAAAALLQSLSANQALVDGNKRLAWVGTRAFLALNGITPYAVEVDEAERFMLAIASGIRTEVDLIAHQLHELLVRRRR